MILRLLADDNTITAQSDEADETISQYMFDYGYVDGTTTETNAYICVEADIPAVPTDSFQDIRIYVTVICHKLFMKLDPSKFTLIGNRRDNLVRYIDSELNGSDIFGVGKLDLDSIKTISAPNGFTAKEIAYSVSDYANRTVSNAT